MENSPSTSSDSEKPKSAKPEKDRDSDEDDDEEEASLLHRLFAKSEKREEEEDKPKGIFERFKKKADVELKPEVEESDEAKLSAKEKPLAVKAVAEARGEQIPEPSGEETATEEIVGDMAAKEFLEEAAQTGDIEAAADHKIAELKLDPARVEAIEKEVEAAHVEAEPALYAEEAEPEPEPGPEPEKIIESEAIVFDRSAEVEPEDAEEDEDAVKASSGTPPPPPPPVADLESGPPDEQPAFGRPSTPVPTLSGNINHGPITPDSPAAERYDQGNPAVTALIGGIIGYYIGRRRGRIKTEKKLLPIQKKLEKQVEDLHWEIRRKEIAIRKAAAEKFRQEGPDVLTAAMVARAPKAEKAPEKTAEQPKVVKLPPSEISPVSRTVERQRAPEANQLHGAKAHEHIGHVLVNAESGPGAKREKALPEAAENSEASQKTYENLPEHLSQRHVETLNRSELLTLSEKIVIDGSSLRQVYETHLIGERGLRRLVAEYLRGGDVKKILRREIVEHEIDFERDPAVRDVPTTVPGITSKASTAPATNATLDKLVEQASVGLGDSNARAYYKARAAYEAHEKREENNKRRLIDAGLVATIVALAAAVAVLYLAHR